jgi:hypothetical protein
MFHIHDELSPLKFGFNFYRLSDTASFGFKFKFTTGKGFIVRYSKASKQWFFTRVWLSKDDIEKSFKRDKSA